MVEKRIENLEAQFNDKIESFQARFLNAQSNILFNLSNTKRKLQKYKKYSSDLVNKLQAVQGELVIQGANAIQCEIEKACLKKNIENSKAARRSVRMTYDDRKMEGTGEYISKLETELDILRKELKLQSEKAATQGNDNISIFVKTKEDKKAAAEKKRTLQLSQEYLASLEVKIKQYETDLANNKETIAKLIEEASTKSKNTIEIEKNSDISPSAVQEELQRQLNELTQKHENAIARHTDEIEKMRNKLSLAKKDKQKLEEKDEEIKQLQRQIDELVKTNNKLSRESIIRQMKEKDEEISKMQNVLNQQIAVNKQLVCSNKSILGSYEEEKSNSRDTIERLESQIEILKFQNEKLNEEHAKTILAVETQKTEGHLITQI